MKWHGLAVLSRSDQIEREHQEDSKHKPRSSAINTVELCLYFLFGAHMKRSKALLHAKVGFLWMVYLGGKLEASGLPGRVITESVDGSLTSIVQPCDVRLIAILKRGIRSKFYLAVMRKVVAGTLKVGEMVQLSREEIVALCEEAFNEFNENQKVDHAIAQAFEVCGMNPFSYSTEHFDKHLESTRPFTRQTRRKTSLNELKSNQPLGCAST